MPYHTVQQGECLSSIAAKAGFADFRTIYDHPQNAEFRKKRPNPDLIFPGDSLFVPEKEEKIEVRSTTQVHTFQVPRARRLLRIVLQDLDGKPLAGVPYKLEAGGTTFSGATAPDGLLEHRIPMHAEMGLLEASTFSWPLKIAHLNPLELTDDDGVTGIQARLSNLGYSPGEIDGVLGPLTEAAVRAFQEDHPPLKVDGVCGPKTRAKLRERYGC